jgi:septal ring factor EnvC (AmiA/AmiB activator)
MPMPPRPPGRTGGPALIIVSAAAALLLLIGGVMGYLWLSTSGELDDTRTELTSQVETLGGTVADRDGQIETLQGELDDAQTNIEDLQTQLTGSESEVEYLQDANDAIAACLDAIDAWFALIVVEASDAEIEDHYNDVVIPTCDEAEEYR